MKKNAAKRRKPKLVLVVMRGPTIYPEHTDMFPQEDYRFRPAN